MSATTLAPKELVLVLHNDGSPSTLNRHEPKHTYASTTVDNY